MTGSASGSSRFRALAALLPVVFPCALLGLALLRGDLVYGWDTLGELYPWWHWAWREIAQGVFPHWNPYVMCGLPFHGLAVVSLLYPFSLLNLVLSTERVIAVWWLLHLSLAGVFAERWARSLGASPLGAALAGVVFGSSEALVSRITAGELPQLAVVTWLPALLWIFEEGLQARSAATIALGAMPIALMLLAGHLQYVAYASLLAATYVSVRLASDRDARARATLWGGVATAWVLGLALAAPQVLPTLDALRSSHRAMGLAPPGGSGIALEPASLWRFLVPKLFGDETGGGYVGPSVAAQTPLYVGVLPLALAVTAIAAAAPRARTLAGLALGTLLYAFGERYWPARLLDALLPPLEGFRHPARAAVLAALPISVLAGLGLDRMIDARPFSTAHRRFLGAAGLAAGIVTTALIGVAIDHPIAHAAWTAVARASQERFDPSSVAPFGAVAASAWRDAQTFAILFLFLATAGAAALAALRIAALRHIGLALVLTCMTTDLVARYIPGLATVAPSHARMEAVISPLRGAVPAGARVLALVPHVDEPLEPSFLRSYGIASEAGEIVPNWLAASGVRTVTGEIGLIPARTIAFTGHEGRDASAGVEPESRLDALAVGLRVSDPAAPERFRMDEGASARAATLDVERRATALPPASFARRVRIASGFAEARAILDDAPGAMIDPRETAVVEGPSGLDAALSRDDEPSPGRVTSIELGTNDETFEVTAARDALLVIVDPYDPRWKAAVDGVDAPVYPTQLMFRGVPVPRGHHRVALWFDPAPFRCGVWILVVLGVPALFAIIWRARAGSRSPIRG